MSPEMIQDELEHELDSLKMDMVRRVRWLGGLGVLCLFASVWAWSFGFGGQLAWTGFGLLLLAVMFGSLHSVLEDRVRPKLMKQVAKGDGNVQVQGRGHVVVHHATGQRMAAGRVEVKPMTARPKAPRKR